MMNAMITSIEPSVGVNHALVTLLVAIMLTAFIKYLRN